MSNSIEKKKITSFYLSNMADVLTTFYGLNCLNMHEIGPYANQAVANNELNQAILVKISVCLGIIGLYALSVEKKLGQKLPFNLEFITEKTINTGNIVVWTVAAWNLLNIILETIY